jgi:SPP1 family predicted phage head-tail adaptor
MKPMNPGPMRERVTIEHPLRTENSMGESVLSWKTGQRIWASVEGVSSKEVLANARQEFDISHRVRIRFQKGLTNNCRFDWKGRKLEIISLLEHANAMQHEAICREVVQL